MDDPGRRQGADLMGGPHPDEKDLMGGPHPDEKDLMGGPHPDEKDLMGGPGLERDLMEVPGGPAG